MIPDFDDHGFLPPGLHAATLKEIDDRFGQQSELRRVQMQSLQWLLDVARRAGVKRIVINGSFVTDMIEPNDVDCVLLVASDFGNEDTGQELMAGFPFLALQFVDQQGFDYLVERFFATDRDGVTKGMIEVIL